jgi:transcriptional regulator with XRE-family HTH domain
MTPAELKTIREAIGLTVPDLAALAGVQERTVRYWESGRSAVPDDVQAQVLKIDSWLSEQAREALATVRALASDVGALPESIHLLRYRESADLWRSQPAYKPLPVTVHAAALARTRAALADLHVRSVIVYMEPGEYSRWLQGRSDSAELRAAWAGEQAA